MEVSCRALIFFERKLLLCKQKEPKRDFWTLPGGSVEKGETLPDCVSREISEEIGIAIETDRMLFIRELIEVSRHRIEFYFSTKKPSDMSMFHSIQPHNDLGEVRFFSIDDLTTIIVKPECLPKLIEIMKNKKNTFPIYLGNVT